MKRIQFDNQKTLYGDRLTASYRPAFYGATLDCSTPRSPSPFDRLEGSYNHDEEGETKMKKIALTLITSNLLLMSSLPIFAQEQNDKPVPALEAAAVRTLESFNAKSSVTQGFGEIVLAHDRVVAVNGSVSYRISDLGGVTRLMVSMGGGEMLATDMLISVYFRPAGAEWFTYAGGGFSGPYGKTFAADVHGSECLIGVTNTGRGAFTVKQLSVYWVK